MTDRAWDGTHEANPAATEDISLGAGRITDDKETTRMRFQTEHNVGLLDAGYTDDGRHNPGSARAYYGSTQPTTLRRPDNANLTLAEMPTGSVSASLGTNDKGRLWLDETVTPSAELKWYDGTAWQGVLSTDWKMAGRRNLLLNGSMEVWQRRATAVAITGTASYLAPDRWLFLRSGAGAPTVERGNTPTTFKTVGGAISRYTAKLTGAATTTDVYAMQRIESMYTPLFAGVCSMSFRLWYDNDNDGTASGTVAPTLTLITPTAVDNYTGFTTVYGPVAATATTNGRVTWSGIDLSAATDIDKGLQVQIQIPSGALDSAVKILHLTDLQFEAARSPTPFQFAALGPELELCKRYYTKTYNYVTPPGTAGAAGPVYGTDNNSGGGQQATAGWSFGTTMRASPTLTYYSQTTGTAGVVSTPGGDAGAAGAIVSDSGAWVSVAGAWGLGSGWIQYHATASAEL